MGKPIRIIVIGDAGVGKSAFLKRVKGQDFSKECMPVAVGIDLETVDVYRNGKTPGKDSKQDPAEYTLKFFEMSSNERFREPLRSVYYKDADIFLLLVDLTQQGSLQNLDRWTEELKQFVSSARLPILLIGTKADLIEQEMIPDKKCDLSRKAVELRCDSSLLISSKNDADMGHVLKAIIELDSAGYFEADEDSDEVRAVPSLLQQHKRKIITAIVTGIFLSLGAILVPIVAPLLIPALAGSVSTLALIGAGALIGALAGGILSGVVFVMTALCSRLCEKSQGYQTVDDGVRAVEMKTYSSTPRNSYLPREHYSSIFSSSDDDVLHLRKSVAPHNPTVNPTYT